MIGFRYSLCTAFQTVWGRYGQFINSNIVGKHVVEEALKERHLIAKGASPGYKDVI